MLILVGGVLNQSHCTTVVQLVALLKKTIQEVNRMSVVVTSVYQQGFGVANRLRNNKYFVLFEVCPVFKFEPEIVVS